MLIRPKHTKGSKGSFILTGQHKMLIRPKHKRLKRFSHFNRTTQNVDTTQTHKRFVHFNRTTQNVDTTQTHKRFKRFAHFNRTTQNVQIFGTTPFFQATAWQVNDENCLLILFRLLMLACLQKLKSVFYSKELRRSRSGVNKSTGVLRPARSGWSEVARPMGSFNGHVASVDLVFITIRF